MRPPPAPNPRVTLTGITQLVRVTLTGITRLGARYTDQLNNIVIRAGTDMVEVIAEAKLVCIRPDGSEVETVARLGRPYRAEGGEWACPVSLDGLHDGLRDARGEDSLQALCLAASLLRQLLEHFLDDGGRVVYPGGAEEVPLRAVFGRISTTGSHSA